MTTVLVTGSSRGIGLELVRQYAADGWRVIATCRDPAGAQTLASLSGAIEIQTLDLSDLKSVDKLAVALEDETIDLLINNAGLLGPVSMDLAAADYDAWREVLSVNVLGSYKVSTAFTPHVARSERKCIVTLSSRMGSIGRITTAHSLVYRASKAALNAAMKTLSVAYRDRGITVVTLSPGYVRTDMVGPNADLSPEQSVSGMRRVIAGLTFADSGRFLGIDGDEIEW